MTMSTARLFARAILNGFDAMFADWQNITLGAQARFENADWHAVHAAMRERLSIYKGKVLSAAQTAGTLCGARLHDRHLWREAKSEYAELVAAHHNSEIAQTFFNSCYCYVFGHQKVRDMHTFALTEQTPPPAGTVPILNIYTYTGSLPELIGRILDDYALNLPYEDRARDIERIVAAAQRHLLPVLPLSAGSTRIEILDSLFFRNKAAYIIGRVVDGERAEPFVLPLLNNERGAIYVDTVLCQQDEISILFSFTRSYFMVDLPVPSQYVRFLKSVMPHKEAFELYTAMGFVKHGKTEFYRSAVAHTHASDDQYVTAPGIKGMVMLVFTLPSFDYVYKVIKDRFTPPKDATRAQVQEKYRFVKTAERAGRMADSQEFTNLAFARARFSDELIAELYREVPSQIEERGRALIIKHVYVERRMTPLNLYLPNADDSQVHNVMDEYGNAIKQLAAANIFPGDMLLKNFGVTRHGRVVFYDYDELCPLTECNFRHLPVARTEEEELASQPWYDVGPNDIFPEEFRLFFSGNQRARKAFDRLHGDIYDPEFWRDLQQQIRAGVVHDVFPYRRNKRFPRPL